MVKKVPEGCVKSAAVWDMKLSLLSMPQERQSKTFCFTSFSCFMMNLCVKRLIKDIIILHLSVMNCLWYLLAAKRSQSLSVSVYILLHYLLLNSHPFQIDLPGCNFPSNCSFIWVTNINGIHNPRGVHSECSNVKMTFECLTLGWSRQAHLENPQLRRAFASIIALTFHKNSEMSVIPSILSDNYGSRDVDCLVLVIRLVVSSTMQVRDQYSRPLRNPLPNISLQGKFSLTATFTLIPMCPDTGSNLELIKMCEPLCWF